MQDGRSVYVQTVYPGFDGCAVGVLCRNKAKTWFRGLRTMDMEGRGRLKLIVIFDCFCSSIEALSKQSSSDEVLYGVLCQPNPRGLPQGRVAQMSLSASESYFVP